MPSLKPWLKTAYEAFGEKPVHDLPELTAILECSRRTVLRYLGQLGYHTSYNFNRRYYTLEGFPRFDAEGLWHYEQIWFSRDRTLGHTVGRLVDDSPAGMTCPQLRRKLHVRLTNQMRRFVEQGHVILRTYGHLYVYYSRHVPRRDVQMAERERVLAETPRRSMSRRKLFSTRQSALLGIEVLSAKLHHPDWDLPEICRALQQQGVDVTLEQVGEIFEHFELCKKNCAPGTS